MMEENTQHFQYIMLYHFRKGKNAPEMQEKFVQYTEVLCQTCQKWFARFRAGDFSLDDAPWWGGPGEVDGNQIETLRTIHVSMWEMADIQINLKIPKYPDQ